jgi:hypothetical protein
MKCGLLMETAQTQQSLVAAALAGLHAHTQGLDVVVRDEIRRTLVEELQGLAGETAEAGRALRALAVAASLRVAAWSVGTVTVCGAIGIATIGAAGYWLLPSPGDVARLSAQRTALAAAIARLEAQGGRIDLRRCGAQGRYCVRIDRTAPAFGPQADYRIIAGY